MKLRVYPIFTQQFTVEFSSNTYACAIYKRNTRTGVIQCVNKDIDTHAMVMGYNKHVYSYIHHMYMHSDLSVNNH